jgi:hypothetical protein
VEGVRAINPYLVDGPMVALPRRSRPLWDVPELGIGNKPIDGGHYLFTEEERDAFLRDEPGAEPFFRPFLGAEEFINGGVRYCLWLGDAQPSAWRNMPAVRARVDAVRKLRLESKSAPTQALATTPTRFHVENMPGREALAIPEVSSETRRYIPMGYIPPTTLASNKLRLLPSGDRYLFGVLTSEMHMAWTRYTTGRLESRFQYSVHIVYNNFPWPDPITDAHRARVEARAQGVLDARAAHPGASLADLYDPLAMPKNLADAHRALDAAVDAAYGGAPRGGWASEAARVAFLFARYQARAAPLDAAPRAKPKPRRRARATAEEGLL